MHNHRHHHHRFFAASHRLFLVALVLTIGFAVFEMLGGYFAGSLALLGDAGHMASDALSLAIAAFAAWMAQRPPSHKHSYGLGRAEVIAAWASSILLVVMSCLIMIRAIQHLQHPSPVHAVSVLWIAAIGMLFNVSLAWLLSHGKHSLNQRAALLHVFSDLLATLATLFSGMIIYFTAWLWVDPVLSIFISVLILISSYRLLRESLDVLMEGVPPHVNIQKVLYTMTQLPEVRTVHDLHIWTVSPDVTALSAHIHVHDLTNWDHALHQLKTILQTEHHIQHITLQPEGNIEKCQPCDSVSPT